MTEGTGTTMRANPRDVDGGGELQLRFADKDSELHTLNAAQFAEVLEGLVSLTDDLAKAGAFGDGPPPEVRVEPPKEGSFVIEVMLNWYYGLGGGEQVTFILGSGGLLGQALNVGTRSMRAEVSNVQRQENGLVLLTLSDNTVAEVTEEVWRALNKSKKKTKRALRKVLAPLSDDADTLEVKAVGVAPPVGDAAPELEQTTVVLDRDAYRAVAHDEDEIDETVRTFEVEGRLTNIDFISAEKWRVATPEGARGATVEDEDFLKRVREGLALHSDDIFWLRIREKQTVKNGRTSREWNIERVEWRRRGGDDGDGDEPRKSQPSEST